LITGIGDADLAGGDLVSKAEKSTVRTAVGAKTFGAEKVDGHKTADKKKWNGDPERRKRCPEFGSDQMIGKSRDQGRIRCAYDGSQHRRPDEHIKSRDQRYKNEQARPEGPWRESYFL